MAVTNRLVYVVLGGSLAYVTQYRRTVCHRLVVAPRPEAIAERVHVGIGAHAGIAKQIPCATHPLAAFEYDETLRRTLHLQMAGSANTRQPGAHDYHVEVFHSLKFTLEAGLYRNQVKCNNSDSLIVLF